MSFIIENGNAVHEYNCGISMSADCAAAKVACDVAVSDINAFSEGQSVRKRLQMGLFFVRRAFIDLVNPFRFGVSKGYCPGKAPTDVSVPYVLDYSTHGMFERYDMKPDAEGIVLTRHYLHQGDGYYHSPVKIAHFGLAALNDTLSGRGGAGMSKYRQHLHWMLKHYTEELGGVIWRVPSTAPKYELAFNYASAISQGLALSLLARADGDKERVRARDLSEAALAPLRVRVEDGGLLAEGTWGPCFEEYPCIPYGHVVNGFIFCLNGLYDCYSAYGLRPALQLFELGVQTLREITKVWFVPGWARYDLRDLYTGGIPNLATRHYQYLHSDQMNGLFIITGDQFWAGLARKFEYQAVNPLGIAYSYWCKARKFL